MSAKHTPGPWTVSVPCMGFSAINGPSGKLIFGLAAGSVAEKQPDNVCDANARLIAAARELLETLQAMIDEYVWGDDSEIAVSAQALIRKVTGQ